MKSEDPATVGFPAHDEHSVPPFPAHAIAGQNADEVMKLKTENIRLQRLVAELLVENQQLRERYYGSRRAAEDAVPSAAHNHHRHDN